MEKSTPKTKLARKEILQPSELNGVFIPVVSPFKMVNNKISLDVDCYQAHIVRLVNPHFGVSGIFLGANVAQARDMDMETLKLSIVTGIEAVRKANEDLPVVVGALRKDLKEIKEIVKFAEESGADAIVLAPGYTKNPEETLRIISKFTKLKIIIYNNPKFQKGQDLTEKFLVEAASNPNVLGIKDTSGKPEYFRRVLDIFHLKDKKVMQGDTKTGKEKSIREADGMVPVEANLFPEHFADLLNPQIQFDNKQLADDMGIISNKKVEIGGDSTAAIKGMLVEAGIFDYDLAYPKAE